MKKTNDVIRKNLQDIKSEQKVQLEVVTASGTKKNIHLLFILCFFIFFFFF